MSPGFCLIFVSFLQNYPNPLVRRLHLLFMSARLRVQVSRLVFVTVTVRTPRYRQLTPIASTTWLPLTPMLSYASPAHCTASDKPYTAPVPTAPLQSDHRDSNCGSSREGKFVIVTFSPIEGASALNMAGLQWVYAIFPG